MKRRPDWVAWILQFALGFVVGGGLGFALAVKNGGRRGALIASAEMTTFLWGAALIGAAAASLLGDRLWLSGHYRMLDADEPQHDWLTRLCSILAGLIGIALVLASLSRSRG